jgi:putative transposase
MPRKRRDVVAGAIYHVVNRGNDKRIIYPEVAYYDHFIHLLREGCRHAPVLIIAYCLMPNHFHLVVRPETETALSAYMHWVTGSYASDLRRRTHTRGFGHVFQRRFWGAPVYDETGFIAVLRYVEGNALRAGLVSRAELWKWTSLRDRVWPSAGIIDACPLALPADWSDWVNLGQDEFVLEMIRQDLRKMR